MKRSLILVSFLCLVSFAAGCKTEADRYIDAHPDLQPETKAALRRGEVRRGMTREEVEVALGRWNRKEQWVETGSEGKPVEKELWYYGGPSGVGVDMAGIEFRVPLVPIRGVTQVLFEDGRVVDYYISN
ncbi:MAG: hypothetical protein HY720_27505 [Planctomycetes bacterium]|nr:hypothetical protein [Planctomycetota bacterium]